MNDHAVLGTSQHLPAFQFRRKQNKGHRPSRFPRFFHPGLAMLLALFAFSSGALAAGVAGGAGFLFEFAILMFTVWLASALAMCSQIRFSFKDLQATGVKVSDAEVQCKCNLRTMRDTREPRRETSCDPEGTIYTAQTGCRWHSRKTCGHLKIATKVNSFTPCQSCAVAECG